MFPIIVPVLVSFFAGFVTRNQLAPMEGCDAVINEFNKELTSNGFAIAKQGRFPEGFVIIYVNPLKTVDQEFLVLVDPPPSIQNQITKKGLCVGADGTVLQHWSTNKD